MSSECGSSDNNVKFLIEILWDAISFASANFPNFPFESEFSKGNFFVEISERKSQSSQMNHGTIFEVY